MTTWKESSTPQKQPAAKVAVSAASYIDHTIIIINIIIFFFLLVPYLLSTSQIKPARIKILV